MADDPLAGARAKVARAREHYDAFQAQLSTFMDAHPGADGLGAGIAADFHNEAGECLLWWDGPTAAPVAWSLLLGEFLYNLRSALDHIAHALSGGASYGFPVFTCETTYWKKLDRYAKGLSVPVLTQIKELQPFEAWPDHPEHSTIWKVHDLCNIDKHRVLHLTDIWLMWLTIDWAPQVRDLVTTHFIAGRQRLVPDAPLARYTWYPAMMLPFGKAHMYVQPACGLDVALSEGEWITRDGQPLEGAPVIHMMNAALSLMEKGVLPRFEGLA